MDTTVRLFIIAIIPGIALALAVYLTDRYDREPIRLLIKVFIIGALSAFPTVIVEKALLSFNIFSGLLGAAYTAFIVAGFTEEFFKRAVVMRYAFHKEAFDEKLDGIIYSVYAALGFATIENINYIVFTFPNSPYLGLYRGIFSVPAHMLFAITMGYYLSLVKFACEQDLCKAYYRKSLIVPMLLHGLFDFILMSNLEYYLIIFIPFVIFLWIFNLKKLNGYYRESRSINLKVDKE